jgi:glycosyltransferase involved in cell wall biosynthesis
MNKNKSILPAVSIALCTYNGERFLIEQLDSILSQDYKNIDEIICVDDRSTDNTWKILNEYAKRNPIFKIFKNDINLGFIKNYEKAITLASNQLIAISDQDDIWYTSKISKLVTAIGDNLMAYSDNEYIDYKGKPLGLKFSDKRNLTNITNCLNFTLYNVISGHTILINRRLLDSALPFPLDVPYDFWLSFQAAQFGEIKFVNEPLVAYRQHENNIIGAFGVKAVKNKETFEVLSETLIRMQTFAKNVAPHLSKERLILEQLGNTYSNKSISMRLNRVSIYWRNRDAFLHFKKRSKIRKMLYCIKVIWKYE